MLRPGGILVERMPDRERAADTFTCGHCGRIVVVPPKADAADLGGHCRLCDRLICPSCAREGRCDPFEKKLERWEARAALRRDVARGG